MSRGWAKASACCLQTTLSCAFLCHIVSLQYLSRSSLHRLAGLPCRLFLSYGLQLVTSEVHRSSLRRLICPAQDHFIFLTVLVYTTETIAANEVHLQEEADCNEAIWCKFVTGHTTFTIGVVYRCPHNYNQTEQRKNT